MIALYALAPGRLVSIRRSIALHENKAQDGIFPVIFKFVRIIPKLPDVLHENILF